MEVPLLIESVITLEWKGTHNAASGTTALAHML